MTRKRKRRSRKRKLKRRMRRRESEYNEREEQPHLFMKAVVVGVVDGLVVLLGIFFVGLRQVFGAHLPSCTVKFPLAYQFIWPRWNEP